MGTIYKEFTIDANIDSVWDALRDFNAVHRRLVPGFVVDCKPGEGGRAVTSANGAVAQELLVGIHEGMYRLNYTIVGGKASHHMASAQLFAEGDKRTWFVWITDVLPDALENYIDAMMAHRAAVMQRAAKRIRRVFKLLDSVKGVGPVTTLTLLSALPELCKLGRKPIAKLAGIAPLANDSGH